MFIFGMSESPTNSRLTCGHPGHRWKERIIQLCSSQTVILTPSFLCEDVDQINLPGDKGKAVKNLVDEGTHKYISDNEIGLYEHVKNGKINK